MKIKSFFIVLIGVSSFGFYSCGSSYTNEPSSTSSVNSNNPILQEGLQLTEKFQCMSCHKVDEDITGPSYKSVAMKYKGADEKTIATLAQKVITGGSGVWGQTEMTPHPDVSKEDAKKMVEYILLLNN